MLVEMADGWTKTPLPGVLRRTHPALEDERGSFRELWRESWTKPAGLPPVVQANLSRSRAGTLRGLHFHLRQTDLWIIVEGHAHISLVDLRRAIEADPDATEPAIPSLKRHHEELRAGDCVVIPAGVAHGFRAIEDTGLLYLVTNEYDGSDEHGLAWNDAAAGAAWPAGEHILSERDRGAPSLGEAIAAAHRQISSR